MNDWSPAGSMAKSRNLYPKFLAFVKETLQDLKDKGNQVELAGIIYHVGENDMSMPSYRRDAPKWLNDMIVQTRTDLEQPSLAWYVSQQPPTRHERVDAFDVRSAIAEVCAKDPNTHLNFVEGFPEQEKQLVLDTEGILFLGVQMAQQVN